MNNSTVLEIVPFKVDNDFFAGLYELDFVRIALIAFSVSQIVIFVPFVSGIIIFECTNSDHRIFSRLISSLGVN